MPAHRPSTQAKFSRSSKNTSQQHPLASKEQAKSWLQSHGYRVTQARMVMIQILLGSPTPIALTSLEKLTANLTAINFTTAYRFLKELESKALLQVHIWDNGERRFELRALASHSHVSNEHDHHHYVICNQCHASIPIPHTSSIAHLQKKIEETLGFTHLSHILEFFGTCPKCASK